MLPAHEQMRSRAAAATMSEEATALELLNFLADPHLFSRLLLTCEREGTMLAAYIASALEKYAGSATDKAWLSVAETLRVTGAPGRAVLKSMLEMALANRELAHASRRD